MTALPVFLDLPFDPDGPDRNCDEFDEWWDAQNFYLASGGPAADPHRLDQNGDGTACDSLLENVAEGIEPAVDIAVASTGADDFQDRNCSDFETWEAAQNFFLAEGGPTQDPHSLDGDGDGTACQSLPGAPQGDSDPSRHDPQTTPTATPQPTEDEFQDRNCGDFATWQEAQDFFTSEGGPSLDPHRLDSDGNGVACASLPGAPQGDSDPGRQDPQPTPIATPQPAEDEFQDRNCSDFTTWQEAQDFFSSEGGPSQDPHRLDGDGNGVACESLPGAPQRDSDPSQQDPQPTPTTTPQPAEDEFQDRNCGDFATWQEAQSFFLAEGGPSEDPHRLDGDGDGHACQSLPGYPG